MRKEAEDLDEKKLAEAVEQAKKKRILRRIFLLVGGSRLKMDGECFFWNAYVHVSMCIASN